MEWIVEPKEKPYEGDKRIKKQFLFHKKQIGLRVKWLCIATYEQTLIKKQYPQYNIFEWVDTRWID